MAIGDSITAGFLARPSDSDSDSELTHVTRSPVLERGGDNAQKPMSVLPGIKEYRGLSYPIGGDPGAITIPNILSHYSPNLTGMSKGHHPLSACVGGWCVWRYDDGLNGAVSGSTSGNLLSQVRGGFTVERSEMRGRLANRESGLTVDYVLPNLEMMDIPETDWKYINVGIGANDIVR